MAHSASTVQLGTTRSTFKDVTNKLGEIEAGKVVRLKSDDTIVITKADGELLGVSLGKDQSDIGRTAIVRSGLLVPIQLTAAFTPTVGEQVFINDTTGIAGAEDTGLTGVNAVYASGVLTGVKEDGTTTCNVALIDMQGGL
jgi:hypothetical protein